MFITITLVLLIDFLDCTVAGCCTFPPPPSPCKRVPLSKGVKVEPDHAKAATFGRTGGGY